METNGSVRSLRYLLGVLGTVMVVAGTVTVVLGISSVSGEVVSTPDADSEMRFYAVWYVVAGVLLLRSLGDIAAATVIVRSVGAGFFAAGCARALSWIVVGRPGPLAIALMAIELVLPLVIVPWQAAVVRSDTGA